MVSGCPRTAGNQEESLTDRLRVSVCLRCLSFSELHPRSVTGDPVVCASPLPSKAERWDRGTEETRAVHQDRTEDQLSHVHTRGPGAVARPGPQFPACTRGPGPEGWKALWRLRPPLIQEGVTRDEENKPCHAGQTGGSSSCFVRGKSTGMGAAVYPRPVYPLPMGGHCWYHRAEPRRQGSVSTHVRQFEFYQIFTLAFSFKPGFYERRKK